MPATSFIKQPVDVLIFDWGDTIMRDFGAPGPMAEWEEVSYIAGAEQALKALSQKYICAIATSADHSGNREMIAALKRVGAHKYFNHFFSSQQLGFKKPDPAFFNAVARQLNLDPGRCVMIGNFYEKDIIGAKAIGMQTILFDENKSQRDFPDADLVIHEMHELLNIFN